MTLNRILVLLQLTVAAANIVVGLYLSLVVFLVTGHLPHLLERHDRQLELVEEDAHQCLQLKSVPQDFQVIGVRGNV